MFHAHLGTQLNDKVLYLDSIAPRDVETLDGNTVEDANAIIKSTGAKEILFGVYGMPRRAVSAEHTKLQAHLRKFIRLIQALPS